MSILPASLFVFALLSPGASFAQPASNPSFTLENKGSAAILEFYATPAGRANWGRDRLDGKTLAAGGKAPIRLPADGNCIYDLRAVFTGGHEDVQHEVNVCKVEDVTVGGAPAARELRLHNGGSVALTKLLLRPAGAGHKPVNLTQDKQIAPGAEGRFDLPGSDCLFDLRATFADGRTLEKHAADLCKSPDLSVQ